MRSAAQTAFLKTVELGSIRSAARALNLDPSGVSRRITQLEQRLGTRLVDRSGNRTEVTQQGQLYFDRLKTILDQLDALEDEIKGEDTRPTGLLRVTGAIDFGQEFLAPWMLEFRRLYPQVDVDLVLASQFLDLAQAGVDLAIRIGTLPDSNLIARKLADVPRVMVGSQGYLDRMGVPKTAEDLSAHEFIFFSPEHRARPLDLIAPGGETLRIPRKGGLAINAVRSVVGAVRAGHGLHVGPLWAFADHVASGELQVVLPNYRFNPLPLYVLRQPSVVVPARVSLCVDFLAQQVRKVKGLKPVG